VRTLKEAASLLEKVRLDVDPRTPVRELSVGMQQMVEIAKSFTVNASLIIMDEPTASLADKDVERLFVLIRQLKQDAKSIVYISHRMNEIFAICDDILVMRDGSYVAERETAATNEGELIQDIVGRKMEEQYPYVGGTPGKKVVEISHLTGKNCKNNSGAFYAGVTTGLFGLVGSGRTELARALFGAYPLEGGDIFVDGTHTRIPSPESALLQGVVYLSEDRKGDGLVLSLSVSSNTMLSALKEIQGLLFHLDTQKEGVIVGDLIKKLRIKTPSPYQAVKNLSGGNQQKVALARALTVRPRLLLLDEPTRGIDVGAKKEIYDLINELKLSGIAVVMVSSDMNEILGISDRVMVFCEGKITGTLERGEMDSKKIMRYAVNLEVTGNGKEDT
jgi:ribose transport system ATP-binding protein